MIASRCSRCTTANLINDCWRGIGRPAGRSQADR